MERLLSLGCTHKSTSYLQKTVKGVVALAEA
jgi:hypothetical protein